MLVSFDQIFLIDEPIPDELITLAQDCYTWRTVDAELLDLLIDSSVDEVVVTRAESLQRFMAFGDSDRGVHFECRPDGSGFVIEGSVVPVGPYEVRAHRAGPDDLVTNSDDLGHFALRGLSQGSMRLSVRLGDGELLMTPWFRLES